MALADPAGQIRIDRRRSGHNTNPSASGGRDDDRFSSIPRCRYSIVFVRVAGGTDDPAIRAEFFNVYVDDFPARHVRTYKRVGKKSKSTHTKLAYVLFNHRLVRDEMPPGRLRSHFSSTADSVFVPPPRGGKLSTHWHTAQARLTVSDHFSCVHVLWACWVPLWGSSLTH